MEAIKEKPRYQNEAYLKQQFIILKKTAPQIAKNNKVSYPTIYKWLKIFGIKKKEELLHHNKQWLYYQYLTLKKSRCKIAEECKANVSTINIWLKKFEIPIRPKKEATKLYYKQKNKLNNDLNIAKEQYRVYKNGLINEEINHGFYT